MRREAHPDDILIVAWPEEAQLYPQFRPSQIINMASPSKLEGRRFRKAWISGPAAESPVTCKTWRVLHREAWFSGAEILPISEYVEGV